MVPPDELLRTSYYRCDTAIAVLAERGMRGLTHRAVDEAAGLPAGSTSNHARTRAALLVAAMARMAEREAADIAAAMSAGAPPRHSPETALGTPGPGTSAPESAAGTPAAGTPGVEALAARALSAGTLAAESAARTPGAGTPAAGTPTDGASGAGTPTDGAPGARALAAGTHGAGALAAGTHGGARTVGGENPIRQALGGENPDARALGAARFSAGAFGGEKPGVGVVGGARLGGRDLGDPDVLADMLAGVLHHQLTRARTRLLARYEFALEATRRPELRAIYDEAGRGFREPATALLAAAGSSEPERHGRMLIVWSEGVQFDSIAGAGWSSTPSLDELRADLRQLLRGMLGR